MIDWTDPKNDANWNCFLPILGRLETLEFSRGMTGNAWKELAIVLYEETKSREHAVRAIDLFLKTVRLDEKSFERHDVPSAPELREFVRKVPKQAPPAIPTGPRPEPCEDCRPNDGQWRIVQENGVEVPKRCPCDRGKYLAKLRAAHRGGVR